MSLPHPATSLRLLNVSSLPVQPWKNGGGTTREIQCHPPQAGYDTFDWRISLAQIQTPGDFSRFPGIDRHIMLIEGSSMHLRHEEQEHVLHPFTPYSFAGEDKMACLLPQGPTQDLNLMLRRGRAQGSLQAWTERDTHQTLQAGTHFLYAAQGNHDIQAQDHRWTLKPGLALTACTSSPLPLTLHSADPDAVLVYVYIAPTE